MSAPTRPRRAHRKPPPLPLDVAEQSAALVASARERAQQARELLVINPAAEDCLAEVARLLDLAGVHAAAEVDLAREAS